MKTKHLLFILFGIGLFFACEKASESLTIQYPETGQYGPNILANGFVEAKKTEYGRYEYSVRAELPEGNSSLKIVIKTIDEEGYELLFSGEYYYQPWGGYYPHTLDNWLDTNWDSNLKGNTFTVVESGKNADASVVFLNDCIIEYYENGATEPTKVKEIKVIE